MESASVPVPARPHPAAQREGPVRSGLREAGELTEFTADSVRALPGTLRYFSEVMRQAAILVSGTTVLLLVMNAFLGISVVNFGFFFLRSIGASDFTGLASGIVDIRQAATTMFGYVFAAKVCCGLAAEIGSMKIQQELDALDTEGVDPLKYVIGTRILAVIVFIPLGAAVSLIGQTIGSYIAGVIVLKGLSPQGFLDVHWGVQTPIDQFYTFLTIGVIAIVTSLVACFYGRRVTGGPASVGQAVARSLMVNLVLVHLIAVTMSVFFYSTTIRLPIAN
jgi:phospholipid/cholesterol/gamma-HCH transport system permease protein